MKIHRRTIISIGIILIFIGIFALFSNYFAIKKAKVYDTITLAMSELPSNIDSDNSSFDDSLEEDTNGDTSNSGIDNNDNTSNKDKNKYTTPESYYIGKLEIPSINLSRGFTSINSKYNNVNYNITVIKGSSYPDVDKGNFILAGHSGSSYRGYFSKLYKLKVNDYAYVYYNNIKYKYKLEKIYEEEKTGTVRIYRDKDKNTMTLITCTKGSNTKQSVYIFNLIEKENY